MKTSAVIKLLVPTDLPVNFSFLLLLECPAGLQINMTPVNLIIPMRWNISAFQRVRFTVVSDTEQAYLVAVELQMNEVMKRERQAEMQLVETGFVTA